MVREEPPSCGVPTQWWQNRQTKMAACISRTCVHNIHADKHEGTVSREDDPETLNDDAATTLWDLFLTGRHSTSSTMSDCRRASVLCLEHQRTNRPLLGPIVWPGRAIFWISWRKKHAERQLLQTKILRTIVGHVRGRTRRCEMIVVALWSLSSRGRSRLQSPFYFGCTDTDSLSRGSRSVCLKVKSYKCISNWFILSLVFRFHFQLGFWFVIACWNCWLKV